MTSAEINIPESILNKPGRLTKEEFEVMKTPHHNWFGDSGKAAVPAGVRPCQDGLRYMPLAS